MILQVVWAGEMGVVVILVPLVIDLLWVAYHVVIFVRQEQAGVLEVHDVRQQQRED